MFDNRHHHTHIGRLFGRFVLGLAKLLPRRALVEGSSMSPTFLPGDRLVIGPPWMIRSGCVVALTDPRDVSRLMVKRVASIDTGGVEVLGDNPPSSTDSRHFGLIDRRLIQGRVLYRYSPPERTGWWPK